MSSTKGKVLRFLSRMVLKQASVVDAQEVGAFRRLVLKGDIPAFSAGTKIQVLLPSDDARTYSPIAAPGGMVLLGWKHAGGPGARWMSEVTVGDEVQFLGPQRSLELEAGPVVLVGDETSVAVAAALEAERPGQVHAVIEADDDAGVRAAGESVGLRQLVIVPRGERSMAAAMVVAKRLENPSAVVALTGGSESVIAVRDALRLAEVGSVKTKPYWIPGRAGLD